jgi:hypothetical protein
MAVTRIQVFYQRGEGDKWTNVYHANGASLEVVRDAVVSAMLPQLIEILSPACRIVKFLVSSLTDDTFLEQSVEEFGDSAFTDSLLPFFNCVKVLIQTASLGRPDVKFIKGWLTEAITESGVIEPTEIAPFVGVFNTMIGDMEDASAFLCADDGGAWTTVSVQPTIQMRQMHRRRRRTVTP